VLGGRLRQATNIPCEANDRVMELLRGCRMFFDRFVKGLKDGDLNKAQLGLAHSYSRAKVKFNVNRADNMIIQVSYTHADSLPLVSPARHRAAPHVCGSAV
jgi:nucleolar protein 56